MRQKLGQHFLKNKEAIKTILRALEVKTSDIIIEVGPGHGELTQPLVETCRKNKCQKVIAVEKDIKLAERLKKKTEANVVSADILKILPQLSQKFKDSKFKIVGNIPYYLTGKLLRIIAELKDKPSLIVFTLQKEVGLRICGQPPKMIRSISSGSSRASRGMNLLAASVQYWAKPKIIGYISKKDFQPAPEVDSVIIKLLPINPDKTRIGAEKYYKLIRILFKQPRKTILNNLLLSLVKEKKYQKTAKIKIAEKLKSINIEPFQRPQDLDINKLITLSQILYN